MGKTVKKLTALVLALSTCALLFVGCGKKTTTTTTAAAGGGGTGSNIVIGVLLKCQSDPFQRKLNEAQKTALDQLKSQGKIKDYVQLDADSDVQKQLNEADNLIAKKVNVIVMAPQDANGCAPIVEKANAAGIPIVVVNSKTTNVDKATAFVGSNDVEAGEILGNFIVSKLGGAGKASGVVLHLQGAIGNSAQIDRGKGIHNILDKEKGIKIKEELSAKWQRDEAMRITEDWLTKYPKIAAIVADNDDMSVGAMNAALNAGRKKDIIIIGVDAIDDALTAVDKGNLDGSVFQDAAGQGKKAVEVAYAVASKQQYDKTSTIPFVLITKQNVAQYLKK